MDEQADIIVKNEYDTIHDILGRGASFARFGDGELRVCIGGKIKSQPYNKNLQRRLLEILNVDDFGFLIGIPRVYDRTDNYPSKRHWQKFMSRPEIKKLFKPGKQYHSSFISRMESAPNIVRPTFWRIVEDLWIGRDIIAVQGDHGQLKNASEKTNEFTFSNSIQFVIGPGRNAWSQYNEILEQCLTYPEDCLFVISLGATATVLAYDLWRQGRQALDIGRMIMHHKRILEL